MMGLSMKVMLLYGTSVPPRTPEETRSRKWMLKHQHRWLQRCMISTAPPGRDVDAAHFEHLHQGIMVLAVTVNGVRRTRRTCTELPKETWVSCSAIIWSSSNMLKHPIEGVIA